MRILEGHTGGVRALAYHREGKLLVSGGEDGRVFLWKNHLRTHLTRYTPEHTDWVRGVAFSHDGRRFASVGWDSRLFVWWTLTFQGQLREPSLDEQGWSMAYSPDGSMLAMGCGTGAVRIYHPTRFDSGPFVLRGHSMPITQLVFSPDSRKLYSASHDRTVREWDAHWGTERRMVCQFSDWIRCLALSPRGDAIAIGGDTPGIAVKTLDGTLIADLCGDDQPITALAFTPDGRSLVSAGRDGVVQVWDVMSWESRFAFDWGLGALYSLAVAPDGMTAAVGGADGRIVVWDLDG